MRTESQSASLMTDSDVIREGVLTQIDQTSPKSPRDEVKTTVSVSEPEEDVIELSTDDGIKVSAGSHYSHRLMSEETHIYPGMDIELVEEVSIPYRGSRRRLLTYPVTNEFEVNTEKVFHYHDHYPSVATLNSGDFVIVWQSSFETGQNGSDSGVYARRFSTTGAPQGGKFRVDTGTITDGFNYFMYPSITALDSGDFVVVWDGHYNSGDSLIYARRYSAIGVPRSDEFRVNSEMSSSGLAPRIATLNSGDFVVVWWGGGSQDYIGIYCRRFSAIGVPQGNQFLVNMYTRNGQTSPSVAALNSGGFVVVWKSFYQESAGLSIYYRLFSATGVPQSGELMVNRVALDGPGSSPSVAALNSGDFVVAWMMRDGWDGGSAGIYARRYSAIGLSQGGEFQVNTYTINDQSSPSVVALNSGGFMVAWQSDGQDGSEYGIYARIFSVSGVAKGTEFQLNTYTFSDQDLPSVATLSSGNFVAVWDGFNEVRARLFNSDNQVPTLLQNHLVLSDGMTVAMTSGFLDAADDLDFNAVNLNFIASDVHRGYFALLSAPSVAVNSFIQGQLRTGQICFVHDGSNQAPSYRISVSDGELTTIPQPADIDFDFRPVMQNNGLTLHEDEVLSITSDMISGTDNGNQAGSLIFNLNDVRRGRFELVDNSGVGVFRFTQSKVQLGQLRFVHDGGCVAPSYQISVSDGLFSTTSVSGNINFNCKPVMIINTLSLKDGEAVMITPSMLKATDDKATANELMFSVSDLQNGQFELIASPGTRLMQFTQYYIQKFQVRFVHDGSNLAPAYQISVDDGQLSSIPSLALVTFNARPILVNNKLDLTSRSLTIPLTPSQLQARDDHADDQLIFTVSNVRNGRFELTAALGTVASQFRQVNIGITRFTQADIKAGRVQFVRTDLVSIPSYEISVSDGDLISPAQPVNITGNQIGLGGEFRVNTLTVGSQEYPSITRLKSGDFVISWQSEGQDGNLTGIYAQRYSSTGTLQGSEFRVNTYTTNFQNYSSVAGLSTGDFVVTWSSIAQDDKSNSGVFAQRYTSAGLAQGVEFQVNTYTVSHQRYSRVAGLSTGDFVVAWASSLQDGSNEGVFAQRYSTTGIKQGNEFQVNTYTLNHQSFPSLAGLTTGDFVITWHSYGQDGDRYGVYAQRYSSLGVPQGTEFRVNTRTLGDQLIPDITAAGGNFVITWQGIDSDRTGIYAQRYSNLGVAQGAEFLVNTYTKGYQQSPRIAGLSSGDFVIVWQSEGRDGSGYGVYGQYYAASGTASGSEFRINIPTLGNQLLPSVTGLSDKDFVVTWQDDIQDSSGAGIYARLLRNNQGSISTALLDKEESDREELVEESKETLVSSGWGSSSNVKKQKLRGEWHDDQVLGFPPQEKWDEEKVLSPDFLRGHARQLQALPAGGDWSLDVKPLSEPTPSSLLTGLGYGLAIVGAAGLGIGLAVQCWRTWQSWRKQGEDSSVSRISAYCGHFFSRTVPTIHSEQIKATAESSPTLGTAVNF
jgi:hypothetical protein